MSQLTVELNEPTSIIKFAIIFNNLKNIFDETNMYFRENGSAVGLMIEDSTAYVAIGHSSPNAPLDVRKDQANDAYIGIFRNASSNDSVNSYILNLWHSQEDDSYDYDTGEHWIQFSDNSGTFLGEITHEVTYTTFTGAHTSQIISG